MIPMTALDKHNIHKKYEVAMTYVTCGSIKKTSRNTGVDRQTMRTWMRSSWWPAVAEACAELQAHKFRGRLYHIMDKALAALEERIEEGDVVLTRNGREMLPIKGKDLMAIAASAASTRAKVAETLSTHGDGSAPTSKKLLELSLALAHVAKNAQENKTKEKPPIQAEEAEWTNVPPEDNIT